MQASANPYQSPASPSLKNNRNVRCFQVGVDEVYTVVVQASPWTGISTYSIDSTGVAGSVHRGPCQLEVGKTKPHQVQIAVDNTGKVNAYVDGELVQANLFAKLRILVFANVIAFIVLCVAIFSLAIFFV